MSGKFMVVDQSKAGCLYLVNYLILRTRNIQSPGRTMTSKIPLGIVLAYCLTIIDIKT
jgi:hypothetical protein